MTTQENQHFSKTICPFRGHYVYYGNADDTGWSDNMCVGPGCAMWGFLKSNPAHGQGSCAMGTRSEPACCLTTRPRPQ